RERKKERGRKTQDFVKIIQGCEWNSSGVIPIKVWGELIHVSGLLFDLDWLYIEGTIDPNCLGKELWKLVEFRDEKRKRKVGSCWAKKGWESCLSERHKNFSEV
ncbi:hypothetical protein MTR67_010320, partial [Solanum verrucosum]